MEVERNVPSDDTLEFAVQELEFDGSGALGDLADPVQVQARSPLEAGQMVLGDELTLHGAKHHLRAKVWRIGEDFVPVETLLYRIPPKQER